VIRNAKVEVGVGVCNLHFKLVEDRITKLEVGVGVCNLHFKLVEDRITKLDAAVYHHFWSFGPEYF